MQKRALVSIYNDLSLKSLQNFLKEGSGSFCGGGGTKSRDEAKPVHITVGCTKTNILEPICNFSFRLVTCLQSILCVTFYTRNIFPKALLKIDAFLCLIPDMCCTSQKKGINILTLPFHFFPLHLSKL